MQRIRSILTALALIAVSLTAASATDQAKPPQPSAKSKNSAKEPAAKPKAVAKKSAGKPASPSTVGMIPPAAGAHPAPASTPAHSHYDVPQPKSLADTPDTVLNSKVRASLMSALNAARSEDINPETSKGVVTLTGSVKTKELRARAEQVARGVHGVRAVKNQLAVK